MLFFFFFFFFFFNNNNINRTLAGVEINEDNVNEISKLTNLETL